MDQKFNEHDWRGEGIQNMIEIILFGIGQRYKINYHNPPHDIARKFLNEIVEFEAMEDQVARLRAASEREVKENADKSGG